jgi:hypothetical protein
MSPSSLPPTWSVCYCPRGGVCTAPIEATRPRACVKCGRDLSRMTAYVPAPAPVLPDAPSKEGEA